ncbi:hypothetical protein B0H13DRAFT_2388824 [Mycena leptocephala]|nr:hypothetical protein B0H13DRAFT_2388824 [Mycena leptocephala]
MPVLVEGLPVTTPVTLISSRRSVLPASFRAQLPPGSPNFLVTTVSGHHSISFLIVFALSVSGSFHLELGLDWVALLRDSLIGLGRLRLAEVGQGGSTGLVEGKLAERFLALSAGLPTAHTNLDGNNTCSIRVPANTDLDLILMFEEQTRELAIPVRLDDIDDVKFEREPQVHPWTHARRFATTGGVIEAHTNFTYVYSDSVMPATRTIPKTAAEFPLKLNDWVLFDATLHRSGPRFGPDICEFLTSYRLP